MQAVNIHQALQPIAWLIGRWKSIHGQGYYPTIKPFAYCEELEFESLGQPLLNYKSKTWHPVENRLMHLESGFLRINPGTCNVAFMVSHNFGIVSLEEGTFTEHCLNLKSTTLGRMSFGKDPAVTEIIRSYVFYPDTEKLLLTLAMATKNTPLTEHLKVEYEKMSA